MADAASGGASGSATDVEEPRQGRKVRVHKTQKSPASELDLSESSPQHFSGGEHLPMSHLLVGLIPGLEGLDFGREEPVLPPGSSKQLRRQREYLAEREELDNIFDMSVPNPVDHELPEGPWTPQQRPPVRKVQLSPYQYEMINYQRMLMRKNIWYYRDRMSVPRGPCPLHVLKDAWVQGCIDENTLVWGQGLYDWLPAKNVKLLLPMIRTVEVQLGAWIKRTFSLKPALNRIREGRKEQRDPEFMTSQVDRMR